jgi:hypothetical protein
MAKRWGGEGRCKQWPNRRASRFHRPRDRVLYALGTGEYLVVPTTNDPSSPAFQPPCSALVVIVVRMLAAIGFDRQGMLDADEVDDEPPDRMLTTEFATFQTPTAQNGP